MPGALLERTRSVQPFQPHEWRVHPLTLLRELDNQVKHRRLLDIYLMPRLDLSSIRPSPGHHDPSVLDRHWLQIELSGTLPPGMPDAIFPTPMVPMAVFGGVSTFLPQLMPWLHRQIVYTFDIVTTGHRRVVQSEPEEPIWAALGPSVFSTSDGRLAVPESPPT